MSSGDLITGSLAPRVTLELTPRPDLSLLQNRGCIKKHMYDYIRNSLIFLQLYLNIMGLLCNSMNVLVVLETLFWEETHGFHQTPRGPTAPEGLRRADADSASGLFLVPAPASGPHEADLPFLPLGKCPLAGHSRESLKPCSERGASTRGTSPVAPGLPSGTVGRGSGQASSLGSASSVPP